MLAQYRWLRISSTPEGEFITFNRVMPGERYTFQRYPLTAKNMSRLNRGIQFIRHYCSTFIPLYGGGMEFTINCSQYTVEEHE
jgi:hypothetical protein